MNDAQVDQHLDQKTLLVLTWKNPTMKRIASVICRHYIADKIAWSDEMDLSFVRDEDRNCIGLCWRLLVKPLGIIEPMGQFKRSKTDSRRGGWIFKYRIVDEKKARALLNRFGEVTPTGEVQPELIGGEA